jgi:alkylation response protein AidB-like acyl-CoA dehydrogenase
MDFELDDETVALRDLADEILSDFAGRDRVVQDAEEEPEPWVDQEAHRQLGLSGVLGAVLPESAGGAGLGFLAVHQVLERVGWSGVQVPVWESVVLGALPIARHGSDEQKHNLLPRVVAGESLLTAALGEPGPYDRAAPRTQATSVGGRWRLRGTKSQVPLGPSAHRVLVPATDRDGRTGLFVLDPSAPGVGWAEQTSVSGRPAALLTLDDAPAELLGQLGTGVLEDVLLHAEAGLAALQAGICAKVLRLTADHTSHREQFGQPLAAFQAVRQRLADGYIDVEALRLTSLQAAWLLTEEDPTAARAVAIAKYWACEVGHRGLHGAHHLHGGTGIDLDHALPRYFRFAKYIEMTLGTAGDHLRILGSTLAQQGDVS